MNKSEILKHYLHCALWTAELDAKDIEDISNDSIQKAKKDVDSFVNKAKQLLKGMNDEQIGHDFWLTRNGHGAGFWDRGLGIVGDKLSDIARKFKEVNVFDDEASVIIE